MESEVEIKSLQDTDFRTLNKAFSGAFADYEVHINERQLQAMLTRRGYLSELSFGAFDGDELVAFTFNGVGLFGGISTAYDTGTGTLAAYRGQGLATEIFEYSIPYLRKAGVRQYLLEVLQHNEKAVSVYRNLGFEITREFNYFMQTNELIELPTTPSALSYLIKEVSVSTCQSGSSFAIFILLGKIALNLLKERVMIFSASELLLKTSLWGIVFSSQHQEMSHSWQLTQHIDVKVSEQLF